MSFILHENNLYARSKSTGELVPIGMVASGADESLEAINTYASQKIAATKTQMDADAQAARESIPSDYTELSDTVNELQEDLADMSAPFLVADYNPDPDAITLIPELAVLLNADGTTTQVISGDDTYRVSQFIRCKPGDKLTISAVSWDRYALYCLYDGNKRCINSYISAAGYNATKLTNSQIVAPDDCFYIRIAWFNGTTPDGAITITRKNIYKLNSELARVADGSENTPYVGKVNEGRGLIDDTGLALESTTSNYHTKYTEMFPVRGGDVYEYMGLGAYGHSSVFFYDSEKSLIDKTDINSILKHTDVAIPDNARFCVFASYSALSERITFDLRRKTDYRGATNNLKWAGKKWVVVGDSLTAVNNRTTMHYHDYVADATGIEVINMGEGGSGYKKLEESNFAFYQRVTNIPADADVVTIFGSFNDYSAKNGAITAPIGNVTDADTSTIAGCINRTIDEIQTVIPAVSLGIVFPTPWAGTKPNADSRADAYVQILEDICKARSIPYLDLYHCSNLRPWDADFLNVAYTKDRNSLDGNPTGTHPDETGHRLIAPRFKVFLESLIM